MNMQPSLIWSWLNRLQNSELYQVSANSSSSRGRSAECRRVWPAATAPRPATPAREGLAQPAVDLGDFSSYRLMRAAAACWISCQRACSKRWRAPRVMRWKWSSSKPARMVRAISTAGQGWGMPGTSWVNELHSLVGLTQCGPGSLRKKAQVSPRPSRTLAPLPCPPETVVSPIA